MQIIDVLNLIIAIFGLIISIVAILKTEKNSRKVEVIEQGEIELHIREMILDVKARYMEMLYKISKEEQKDENNAKILAALYEDYLNVNEEACAKYLDGKVDKERFKRNYTVEIRRLVEEDLYDKIKDFSSNYNAIKKVYDEWNNLEK